MKNFLDTQSYLITKVLCVLLKLRLCQPFWGTDLYFSQGHVAQPGMIPGLELVIYIRGVSSLTPIS